MAAQNNQIWTGLQALPTFDLFAQIYLQPLDPTSANYTTRPYKNFQIGTFWLTTTNHNLWYLANLTLPPHIEGNWVQISTGGIAAQSFPTDSGTATPNAAGILNVLGGTAGRDINTSGSGNTIHVDLNNSITLGDLSAIAAGSNALSATTGDINLASGNIKLTVTNVAGSSGEIQFGGSRFVSNFGTDNTFIGAGSGNTSLNAGVAIRNTAVGSLSMPALTTGQANTAIGFDTLNLNTTGSNNTAVGHAAMPVATTGSTNVAVGANSMAMLTTGGDNVGLGVLTLQALLTGTDNVALGTGAGGSFAGSEAGNICINSAGAITDSNVLRIGQSTGTGLRQLNKAFIHGIRGITTGIADAVAVLIDSAGQLGTVSSSARYKENIQTMNGVSDAIMQLRPVIFNYKQDKSKKLSYGLIAEEVAQVIPNLVCFDEMDEPETVKYHDLPVLLLNEVQKQRKLILDLISHVGVLEQDVMKLKARKKS